MSYHLFSMTERTAKKRHICIWCGQAIEPGSRYKDERSIYDGSRQRHRWHLECKSDAETEVDEELYAYTNERPGLP